MEYKYHDNGKKRLSHEMKGINLAWLIIGLRLIQSASFDYA